MFKINGYEFSHAELPDGPNNRRDVLRNVAGLYGGPVIKERMSFYAEAIDPLFEMTVQQIGKIGFEVVMQDLSAALMVQAFDVLAESLGMNLSASGLKQVGLVWRDVFDKTTENILGHQFLTSERAQTLLDVAAKLAPHNEWVAGNKEWIAQRLDYVTPHASEPNRPQEQPVIRTGPSEGVTGGQTG